MQAALPAAFGLVGLAGALALGGKTKPPPQPPLPDRTEAAALASSNEFRRRQGAAANILTGPSGVEAPSPGAKALLGQ